jgi:hypothetical protein
MSAMAARARFICACGGARADRCAALRSLFINLNNEKARESARISQSPPRHSTSRNHSGKINVRAYHHRREVGARFHLDA